MVKLLTGYAATGTACSFRQHPPEHTHRRRFVGPGDDGAVGAVPPARTIEAQRDVSMARGHHGDRQRPKLSDDGAARRWLQGRLVPKEEAPDRRDPAKVRVQPNLLDFVRANRAQHVVDALTIARAYIVAGRPKQKNVAHWGSFDAWTALVAIVARLVQRRRRDRGAVAQSATRRRVH